MSSTSTDSTTRRRRDGRPVSGNGEHGGGGSYLRFAAMIATSMVLMYATTYLNTFSLSHVWFSEMRSFMTLAMGGVMGLVMFGFMRHMYDDRRANAVIVVTSLAAIVAATFLVRTQTTVQGPSYMSAMIPHHSIAILTSERAEIEDVRVCELALGITEAQRKEIAEMEWLLADIEANGPATTPQEADRRPVPTYAGDARRTCG